MKNKTPDQKSKNLIQNANNLYPKQPYTKYKYLSREFNPVQLQSDKASKKNTRFSEKKRLRSEGSFFGRAKHNFAFLINSKLTEKK